MTQEDKELPEHWQQVQSAVWLIGLAILAWQGWWWPGILVLVAISGLTQAAIQYYHRQQREHTSLDVRRTSALPKTCPSCGGPIRPSTVRWQGEMTAICPYCGSTIKLQAETPQQDRQAG